MALKRSANLFLLLICCRLEAIPLSSALVDVQRRDTGYWMLDTGKKIVCPWTR